MPTCAFLDCASEMPLGRVRRHAVFCSAKCAVNNEKNKYRKNNPASGLSTGKTGAISEMLVCADLLKNGYDVFRAVSQSCSCDIAILSGKTLLTVEVRSAKRTSTGAPMYPKHRIRADVVALVFSDSSIKYEPILPLIKSAEVPYAENPS